MESDLSKPYSIVKNTCPAPAGVLPRERLYDLIRYDRGCPVKWIQGPPGSGKTTVVADYIVSSEINHIWYSIDETDVALPVFFQCLASAVTKNVNQKITDFPELTKDQIFNLAIFSRKYFQKIYSAISFPFTLVFDNYQRLLPDSDLHEIMCIGIEEAPPGVSIIFISRKLLPSTFRRLQANSYIEVIAWRDLSLTKDEFNEIIGMKGYAETFSDQILDSLYEQIQGWLAGLVLFLSNLNVKGPVSEDITNIVIEAVYDYFTAEILNHIEEAQRLFLYKSAFLIQPTSAMAKELTGVADAEDILSYFYSNHWFIEKQGQSEPEYHFHPLFRKFLIVQACRFYSKTELLHIKEKAAEILLNASYLDHAIEYIVGISDWQWFKELTIENAHLLIAHGKNLTLIKWMNQLPENILHGNSWLLYWLGVSEIVINPQKSQDYFEIAFSLFRKAKDRTGLFLAWSGIIKANIYKFESGDSFKKWIPVGNDLIEEYPDFPSVDIEVDMLISLLMGSILLGTNRGEIEKRSTRILELSNQISDEWIRKNGIIVMSFYYTINGYIHRSETFLASIRDGDKLENEPLVNQVVGSHLEILNLFYAAKNERCIELAIKQSRLLGLDHLHFWKVPLLGHAAAAALSEENVKDANTYLGKMNSQLKTGLNIDTFFYQILKAWSLLLDDLFLALHLAQNALKLAYGLEFSILIHTALIAVSQIFHELGQFDDAVKTLQKAYQVAEDIQNPLALCQCEITHSYFSLEQDNVSELTKILKKAMGTGRKQDAVNFIFWRRSVMSSICAKALELEIEVEYVKRLIKKRCLMIDASSQNVENWPWKVKIVTLGRFEIIVDDIPIAFTGKVQKTPLAVLKILISFGCIEIREDRISDILWPDSEGDAGYRALITTIQRLRRLIGYKEAIILNEGKLSLNPFYCWVDVWAAKNHMNRLRSCWKLKEKKKHIQEIIQLTEVLYERYKAPFLPDDEQHAWTFTMREQLQTGVIMYLRRLADFWEHQKNWKNVLEICLKGLDVADTSEALFQKLLVCYKHLGCRAEAINAFNRCQNILLNRLGIEPSPKTKAILESVLEISNSEPPG